MPTDEEKIRIAVRNTVILRSPKQTLSTFGITNIYYYIVAEAAFNEVMNTTETVIREGRVVAERPKIVTPYYMSRLEGFGPEARKYFEMLLNHEAHAPGLLYAYKNEPKELNIVSDNMQAVVARLNADIDKSGDPLKSIIKGEDLLWDVSLMKFIFEITRNSIQDNVSQLGRRGLLNMDASGVPSEARLRIEELFRLVEKGDLEPSTLKDELDRWNVFPEYEDRFFGIFKRSR